MSRARPPARHRRQWPIKVTCQSVECARWQCSTPARNEDKQGFGRKRKGVRQVIKAACFARSILFGSTSGGGSNERENGDNKKWHRQQGNLLVVIVSQMYL